MYVSINWKITGNTLFNIKEENNGICPQWWQSPSSQKVEEEVRIISCQSENFPIFLLDKWSITFMSISILKCLKILFFRIVLFFLKDAVSGRKQKLILCIGLENIRNISFNLLVHFTRGELSKGVFVYERIYHWENGLKCVFFFN